MSTYKSMSDAAYEIMAKKKRAIAFNKLWEDVLKETKVSAFQKKVRGALY